MIQRLLSSVLLGALLLAPLTPAHAANRYFLALTAPFPTVTDNVSFEALRAFWQGDAGAMAWMLGPQATVITDPDTARLAEQVLGPRGPNARVRELPAAEVLAATWAVRPTAIALLPFERLEPRWKLLHIDGVNLFEKQADVARYPLAVGGRPGNRDVSKMTVVAMTGVTALVRGTAVQMERKGITYPAAQIRDWLLSADIAHISNEVSFWDKCPKPTFNDGVVMCSNPKYIELLEYVGTDVIELTGNHLWDRGWDKLNGTLDAYDARGWPYFGGGRTEAEALKPALFEINGTRIAFVGCNWFGNNWATPERPGSARCGVRGRGGLDLILPVIQKLSAEGWQVIVGIQYAEFYEYSVRPQQARDFRALRDAGAVVVNGSQGHHAQGFDVNERGFIHFGTGNLFFGDQAAIGARQAFVDRHVFYDGRYLGVDLRTAFIRDSSQPQPMTPDERGALLRILYKASGW
jgi:Bacterial capsule synthesis protein PGA_cap